MSKRSSAKRRLVTIIRDVDNAVIPLARIRKALGAILAGGRREGAVDVIVVDDVTMRRLNRRFKGKDKTTDVLSFPMGGDMPGTESTQLLGEIYCNYAHCKRWVADHGGSIADELVRLAVHGCLHLHGYDHHRPEDQRRMARAENRYLATGGLIRTRTIAGARDYD